MAIAFVTKLLAFWARAKAAGVSSSRRPGEQRESLQHSNSPGYVGGTTLPTSRVDAVDERRPAVSCQGVV